MVEYNGSAYGFKIVEQVAGADFSLMATFTSAPANANVYQIQYRVGVGSWTSSPPIYMDNPGTFTVTAGVYSYRVQLFYSDTTPSEYITFAAVVPAITDNFIKTPNILPLIWYDENRATSAVFQTPHIEQFPHRDRGKAWLQGDEWHQPWQTTDIIYLQFPSTFDPIQIDLIDEEGFVVRSWVGLNKLPNKDFNGLYLFEFGLSLAGITTGCYRFRRTLGSGDEQVTEYSCCQYISSTPIEGTVLIKYKNSTFTHDVIFETEIEFWLRVYGWIDYDNQKKEKKTEGYRNQQFTSQITSSKSTDVIPVYLGGDMGMPAEMTSLIENLHELDEVSYDGKSFTLPPGKEFEYLGEEGYRLRGMKAELEPGLTRYSRVTKINTDPQKKIMYGIAVDQQALADTTGQGSNDVVPLFNVVIQ